MYYVNKLKKIALKNNNDFHVIAWTKIGSSIITGVNTGRCSLKFSREYPDGTLGYHLHAEMDLLRKLRKNSVNKIYVARFTKGGKLTMAKPCKYCEKYLRDFNIKKVYYSNWDGNFVLEKY